MHAPTSSTSASTDMLLLPLVVPLKGDVIVLMVYGGFLGIDNGIRLCSGRYGRCVAFDNCFDLVLLVMCCSVILLPSLFGILPLSFLYRVLSSGFILDLGRIPPRTNTYGCRKGTYG